MNNFSKSDQIFNIVLYTIMAVFGFIVLYPFIYLLAVSLNEGMDALKGGIYFFPRRFSLENYLIIFNDKRLLNATFISVARTVVGTLASLICTSLVAYAFTKKDLIGRKIYNTIFILPMYVTAGIIPNYLIYKMFGMTNTFWIYIIPNLTWAYFIIIMRTFFEDIPPAIQESAIIDGAGDFMIFVRIILPLSLPVIAAVALFNAVFQWNYWLDTILYAPRGKNLDTLISLLAKMLTEQQSGLISQAAATRKARFLTPEALRASMTMVTTLPIILVYPFLQKYFVKGIMIGAVKG